MDQILIDLICFVGILVVVSHLAFRREKIRCGVWIDGYRAGIAAVRLHEKVKDNGKNNT